MPNKQKLRQRGYALMALGVSVMLYAIAQLYFKAPIPLPAEAWLAVMLVGFMIFSASIITLFWVSTL